MFDFLKKKLEEARSKANAAHLGCTEKSESSGEMVELHQDEFFCVYGSVSGGGTMRPGKL